MNDYALSAARLPLAAIRILRLAPWSRNPLMRTGDRIVSTAVLIGAVTCLLSVPIASTVGIETYHHETARMHALDAAKTATTATVLTTPEYARDRGDFLAVLQWNDGRSTRSQVESVPQFAARGASVPIWIGPDGAVTDPPAPPGTGALRTLGIASSTVAAVCFAMWILVAGCRRWIDRRHGRRWRRQLRSVI